MKRRWLSEWSQPSFLFGDVGELEHGAKLFDYMSGEEVRVDGEGLMSYSFGFSCKDLSTLNNSSKGYVQNCMATAMGTTGVTWRGNYNFLTISRPAFITIENVPRLAKTENLPFMLEVLREAGYETAHAVRSSKDFGVHQARKRFWLSGRQKRFATPGWQDRFQQCMQEMSLGPVIPLERCLLSNKSGFLKHYLKAVAAKGPAKAGKRMKWRTDHWVYRRANQILPPGKPPACIAEVKATARLVDREADFLMLLHQQGVSLDEIAKKRPAVEVKHSLTRLNSTHRQTEHVSTILPGSRQVLLRTVPRRMLSGREALAIQGIGLEHTLNCNTVKDSEFMKLAGDAFSIHVLVASILSNFACSDLDENDILEFTSVGCA